MALACSDGQAAAAAGSARPARSARLVLASVCLATFFVSMSAGNLNVAVPVIVRHFQASALTASLIVLVPTATSTALMASMGLSVSDAVRVLLTRVAAEQALPFDVKVPNATTTSAIREGRAGKLRSFRNVSDLMADLNADD